jgi:hypothetical protein
MLDKMSARCAALSVASGDKKYIDGACVLTDSDGDQIFSTFDTPDEIAIAKAKSRQPLQPWFNAALVRCKSAPARSCSPNGNELSRWRPNMGFRRCIPCASLSQPVA